MIDSKNTFIVKSGKLRISDPCYTKDTWCAGTLDNVMNGYWDWDFERKEIESWGHRITSLYAYIVKSNEDLNYHIVGKGSIPSIVSKWKEIDQFNENIYQTQRDAKWEDTDIDVGVDSGQAGIFDEEKYPEIGSEDKEFYDNCCDVTLNMPNAGLVKRDDDENLFGIVSSSGFGDGSYRCMVKKHEDKVIAVKLIFISDEELEEEND
jgi:hypothetical protein